MMLDLIDRNIGVLVATCVKVWNSELKLYKIQVKICYVV